MTKPIIKCVECKKTKEHYSKGKCLNCYKRTLYQSLPKAEKKRRYGLVKKWIEKHREEWNKSMRTLMRKKFKIKPENYRYKKNEI